MTSLERKFLDGKNERMLHAVFNVSLEQYNTKLQVKAIYLPFRKTSKKTWVTHAGQCWDRKDELMNEVLQYTPTHGHTRVIRLVKKLHSFFRAVTGCHLEDLPRVMVDWERWQV